MKIFNEVKSSIKMDTLSNENTDVIEFSIVLEAEESKKSLALALNKDENEIIGANGVFTGLYLELDDFEEFQQHIGGSKVKDKFNFFKKKKNEGNMITLSDDKYAENIDFELIQKKREFLFYEIEIVSRIENIELTDFQIEILVSYLLNCNFDIKDRVIISEYLKKAFEISVVSKDDYIYQEEARLNGLNHEMFAIEELKAMREIFVMKLPHRIIQEILRPDFRESMTISKKTRVPILAERYLIAAFLNDYHLDKPGCSKFDLKSDLVCLAMFQSKGIAEEFKASYLRQLSLLKSEV